MRTVIITMGPAGAHVSGDGFEGRVGAYPIRAVDSTGAGDAFAGGFLAATLAPRLVPATLRRSLGDLVSRVVFAGACGALACLGISGEAGPSSRAQRL